LEIEDAVRRNEAGVVGYAARLSEALTLIEAASWDAALLDMKLANGEEIYPVAERLHAKGADSGGSRPSFRDDAAHPFRDDLAHRSEMMSPTIPG